jgi:hypothetical protein
VSTWNYRVVRRLNGDTEEYDIREIYYDEAGEITMWTQEPIGPNGTSREELMADVELMMEASFRPVLNYADLPGHPEGDSH